MFRRTVRNHRMASRHPPLKDRKLGPIPNQLHKKSKETRIVQLPQLVARWCLEHSGQQVARWVVRQVRVREQGQQEVEQELAQQEGEQEWVQQEGVRREGAQQAQEAWLEVRRRVLKVR